MENIKYIFDKKDSFASWIWVSAIGIIINFGLFLFFSFSKRKNNETSFIPKIIMYSFLIQIGFNFISIQCDIINAYKIGSFFEWLYLILPFLSNSNSRIRLIVETIFDLCRSLFVILEACYCWESFQLFKNPVSSYSFRSKIYSALSIIILSLSFIEILFIDSYDDQKNISYRIEKNITYATYVIYYLVAFLSMVGITISLCTKSQFMRDFKLFFCYKYLLYCVFMLLSLTLPMAFQFNSDKLIVPIALTITGICANIFKIFDLYNCSIGSKKRVVKNQLQHSSKFNEEFDRLDTIPPPKNEEKVINHSSLSLIQGDFLSECFTYLVKIIIYSNSIDIFSVSHVDTSKDDEFKCKYLYRFEQGKEIQLMDATPETCCAEIFHKYNIFSNNVQVFEYAPRVFHCIRKLGGLTQSKIIESFSFESNKENLSKFANSEGKSGSLFFFTHDNQYIIKTISKTELKSFLKGFLHSYYMHLGDKTSSLLAKTYGLYTLEIGIARIHLIMMENLTPFPSDDFIMKFDIKGSTVGRTTKDFFHNTKCALKDKDLKMLIEKEKVHLYFTQEDQEKIKRCIKADSQILFESNLMDYSFYLAILKDTIDISKIPSSRLCYSIDGKYIYLFGIIDYLTQYNQKKSCENTLLKMKNYSKRDDYSAVNPEFYQSRFCNFIIKNILQQKDTWEIIDNKSMNKL